MFDSWVQIEENTRNDDDADDTSDSPKDFSFMPDFYSTCTCENWTDPVDITQGEYSTKNIKHCRAYLDI